MTDRNRKPQGKSGKELENMELSIALSCDEIIRGLKHYRRIARQDMLHAEQQPDYERHAEHAKSRREVYSHLAELASAEPASEVLREALRLYQELPFVTGTPEDRHVDIKGRENALENFFLMVNLEPKIRRQVRSQRSRLQDAEA